MTNRRDFIKTTSLGSAVVAGLPFMQTAEKNTKQKPFVPQKKLNILYFVCHDLGKHLGCYGAPVESPNLDAFASSGIKFNLAFCSSPASSPSRMCAMTGKYAHVSGGLGLAHMGWSLSQQEKTVVDYLNEAGYETVHVGLNHERHAGMNHYQIDEEKHWDDWDAKNAVDKAIRYLQQRKNKNKPFYLNIGTHDVHASKWDKSLYKDYGGPVDKNKVYIPNYWFDHEGARKELAKFQAAIKYLDTHFGRLIKALDESEYASNTVVIFTTDHGIAGNRSKGTLYDRGTEITLLVRLPGGYNKGTVINELIPNIDFAPTVLDMAGIKTPPEMNGCSFWPLITGKEYIPHEYIFTERNFHGERPYHGAKEYIDKYDPVRSIRTKQFHYIRWFNPAAGNRPWLPWELNHQLVNNNEEATLDTLLPAKIYPRNKEELYDVEKDPGEFINLADHPEYASIKNDLIAKLYEWMKTTNDHVLRNEVPTPPDKPGWGPWEGMK